RGGEVEHVEVKGVSGSEPTFIITHGEVAGARTDPAFILFVVTHALSGDPRLKRYSGSEFLERFGLSCLQYRASPKPRARRIKTRPSR
ncbi:MAG TPA: DUF3883 domain-containing protein, partial [Longimicrobiaceae bacterium]